MIQRLLLYACLFLVFCFQSYAQLPPHIFLRASPSADTYPEPATISFFANPYNLEGSILRIEFYLCGTKIAETAREPHLIVLNDLKAGSYNMTAKAIGLNNSELFSCNKAFTVTAPAENCDGITAYAENAGYSPGNKVSNRGHLYECRPWPYSGWCNGAAWAYEPGHGSHWTDAWTDLGPCSEEPDPACETIAPYEETETYGPGNQVEQNGVVYECKPWPYSGWCSGAAWAYSPGLGIYWQDAWTSLGDCGSLGLKKSSPNEIKVTPHPFEEQAIAQLEIPEEIQSLEIFNSQGVLVFSSGLVLQKEFVLGQDLAAGYYILRLRTKNAYYTKTLIKR